MLCLATQPPVGTDPKWRNNIITHVSAGVSIDENNAIPLRLVCVEVLLLLCGGQAMKGYPRD